jgi:hypothetical protein
MTTLAHIMGVPVEESLLTLVPAAGAFVALAGATLRRGRAARHPRRTP